MDHELLPVTDPGRTFVAQCEEHAADFASRAAEHDRDATFPVENIEAMQKSGALAACVPEELGGLGLTSLHDLTVGVNRLARGDGSTAIASNMHLGATWVATRAWRRRRRTATPPSPSSSGACSQASAPVTWWRVC